MKIHILGICGTFMGGLALLAREKGIEVSGADGNIYPPMSTLLAEQGIDIIEGYDSVDLPADQDITVVGNVMRRGLGIVEQLLDSNMAYTSGPQWLYENILCDRWVLAVAGTHGKTTTASMLAWILEYAGMSPGFLIGGVPENFGVSARLGDTPFFVVEADEYDTAFFDKRSKFVHYHPRTVILNNLEYDHADIFPDLNAIKTQFHHLMRLVPGTGLVLANGQDQNVDDVLEMGCWTDVETFGAGNWVADYIQADGSEFRVLLNGADCGVVSWGSIGEHNVNNALSAIAAARHVGVPPEHAIAALAEFKGVKRRMQLRGMVGGVSVYDDFAHHPTAIVTTLAGLRAKVGDSSRIIALLEPRSNTMRMGEHKDKLADALGEADQVWLYQPEGLGWELSDVVDALGDQGELATDVGQLVSDVTSYIKPGDHVLIMSNGGFGGIHDKLLDALAEVA
uniref:UDP-N-acetylmuramate--L-alanyl-gamma-D-glutamyl-meso-2,6-diaminoheptandioate ligase n=1 Tax=uncultured Thiotrichaceae bacterium TaxID=298394 RepID=A0A6S6TZS9_9GAMM|nr:MAG: UDP-N-acetylmuramate:L-alanyl-gamma-D-glutamyl-meso-diaminopimelate ligase (EC [uncultured Thiotrichaceae bacterium]